MRRGATFLTLVGVNALLLSGCITLGPDFETPESQVEAQWLEAEDARVKADPAPEIIVPRKDLPMNHEAA
jgi:hypothetical protein